MTAPDIERTYLRDTRTVQLKIKYGPEHRTPNGTKPIRVTSIELRYDIPTRELNCAEVFGDYADPKDEAQRSRSARGTGIRRYAFGSWHSAPREMPEWLAELVERFRP